MAAGAPARAFLALRVGGASGRRQHQGIPVGGLVVGLALVAAVGGAPGITPTATSQVADSQVLGPIVVLPVAGVTGLGLGGGGRGGLGEGDAGHRNGGRRGRPILLAHPRSSHGGGRRGRICDRAFGKDCFFFLKDK